MAASSNCSTVSRSSGCSTAPTRPATPRGSCERSARRLGRRTRGSAPIGSGSWRRSRVRRALGGATPAGKIETHISFVLLTGTHAYKIKKAVDFGFLDFTTLAARRFFCAEELRLNRRLAPELYLEVVPITGSVDAPVVGGPGPALEYAVKMREFRQDALASRLLAAGLLGPPTSTVSRQSRRIARWVRRCRCRRRIWRP